MTHEEQYRCPTSGHPIKARSAKKALHRLADRLDALECHDRARYLRAHWQRVATCTAIWGELVALVARWEQDRRAVA